jgi:hypothetical protein
VCGGAGAVYGPGSPGAYADGWHAGEMTLNPPGQYADDRKLRAAAHPVLLNASISALPLRDGDLAAFLCR